MSPICLSTVKSGSSQIVSSLQAKNMSVDRQIRHAQCALGELAPTPGNILLLYSALCELFGQDVGQWSVQGNDHHPGGEPVQPVDSCAKFTFDTRFMQWRAHTVDLLKTEVVFEDLNEAVSEITPCSMNRL